MHVYPLVLEGRYVRLEPLSLDHQAGFYAAGREWSLTPQAVREGIEAALRQQAAGTALPFATITTTTGQVVGGTRFLSISHEHRRLEIGSTWIGRPWRRSAINTEAKLLLLTHAFEGLGCVRVEFKVHALNVISRTAVLRIGATEEGTLRNYGISGEDEAHDIVCYSIIVQEWPAVKSHILSLLNRPRDSPAPQA